jgi:hypothetical protein
MMPFSDPEPVESPATADLPAGRRRHRRVLTRRRILIYPCDNPVDGRAIVSLHDFSPRGVSFSHTRLMRPGSQFIRIGIDSRARVRRLFGSAIGRVMA